MHPQTGQSAHLEDRSVRQEPEAVLDVRQYRSSALGIEGFPLVEDQHDGAARRVDPLREALVLAGEALAGIEHEQGALRPVERLEGSHQRVVLGALRFLGPSPHPGGVDEPDVSVGGGHDRVDAVSGGAREVVND